MSKLSVMSRAELVRELIAPLYTAMGSDTPETYSACCTAAAAPPDALVSRKLSIARELLLRDLAGKMQARPIMSSPKVVREWLKLRYAEVEHEVFIVLYLDVRSRLIEAEELFRGTLTHTSVYPREVVKSALARNAATVILAHNHPSGSAEPSAPDLALTSALKAALSLVDVRIVDHFVVAGNGVLSFAEKGLL